MSDPVMIFVDPVHGGPIPVVHEQDYLRIREKFHAARRYLRAANRGAERSAIVSQVQATRCCKLLDELHAKRAENARLRAALVRLRDCDWQITLPDRMDAVRTIAREALGE